MRHLVEVASECPVSTNADVAHLLPRWPIALSEKPVGMPKLLVVHQDLADEIEIRPIGLEHEKFAHSY
jgi:hypothetical protein